MKNILFIYLFIYLFTSCHRTACIEDAKFKNVFFNNISIIENLADCQDSIKLLPIEIRESELFFELEHITRGITPENTDAMIFFEAVTGITCPGYDPGSYVFTDDSARKCIKAWKKWYNQNKCTMTMAKADSLIIEYNKPPIDIN